MRVEVGRRAMGAMGAGPFVPTHQGKQKFERATLGDGQLNQSSAKRRANLDTMTGEQAGQELTRN
jgi:hypothetical protein